MVGSTNTGVEVAAASQLFRLPAAGRRVGRGALLLCCGSSIGSRAELFYGISFVFLFFLFPFDVDLLFL